MSLLAFAPVQIDCGAGLPTEDVRAYGYDGAENDKRRRSIPSSIKSEDDELPPAKRRRLQASASDIQRQFAIAGWAVRKHLDHVTNFAFSSNNAELVMPDAADAASIALQESHSQLDDDIEGIIAEAMEPEQCDAAGRHDLTTMLRLGEARATVTGDHGWIELADGRLQAVESDRIQTPRGEDAVHGIKLGPRGQALAYAVHRRKSGGGYEFERWIPASNFILRGYFDRADQVRGISPMAPALNTLRDLYENFSFALAKQKIAQLFGFKAKRAATDALGAVSNDGDEDRPSYSIDLGAGPWMLDLEPGDDVEMMTADTPGGSFESYSEMMIAISLLALDLPWNMYKVDATNFFGSRAALNLYLQSVKPKRRANVRVLNRWTRRQLQLAVLRGKLTLPRAMTLDQLRWAWTPDGLPWWNPSQEADGALKAIGAALDNPQRICLETGTNAFENIDRIAEVLAYAQRKQVPISYALPPQLTINQGTP